MTTIDITRRAISNILNNHPAIADHRGKVTCITFNDPRANGCRRQKMCFATLNVKKHDATAIRVTVNSLIDELNMLKKHGIVNEVVANHPRDSHYQEVWVYYNDPSESRVKHQQAIMANKKAIKK